VEDELFPFPKYLGSIWFLLRFVLTVSDYPFCIFKLFSLRSVLLVEKIGLPGENHICDSVTVNQVTVKTVKLWK
jgi:hypothetical protein